MAKLAIVETGQWRSVSPSVDKVDRGSGNPSKIEAFKTRTVTWLGQQHAVQTNADRYALHGGELTEWRIYYSGRDIYARLTDALRRAVNAEFHDTDREELESAEMLKRIQRQSAEILINRVQESYGWEYVADDVSRLLSAEQGPWLSDDGAETVRRVIEARRAFENEVLGATNHLQGDNS